MRKSTLRFGAALALAISSASGAHAATQAIFSEDFSEAVPGTYGPGQIPGTKFTLDTRNIDIVGTRNGSFFSCNELSPNGNCLDLLGDAGLGGTITSTSFALTAGVLYTLAFDAAGSGGNIYTAMIGGFSQTFATNDDGSVSHQSFAFTPLTSMGDATLSFRDDISPNAVNGAVLASISVSGDVPAGAVPEPATWAMMIGGFGLVGGAMRRRQARVRFA